MIISDRIISAIRRKWKLSDSYDSGMCQAYHCNSNLKFLRGSKWSYDSDSVASENQAEKWLQSVTIGGHVQEVLTIVIVILGTFWYKFGKIVAHKRWLHKKAFTVF